MNIKMMKDKLTSFILTGGIEKMFIGQVIYTSQGNWIKSIEHHPNGIPTLYKCTLDELVINIGATSENKIEYIVVHMDDLDPDLHIGSLGNTIRNMTMDELLVFFNEAKIEWSFKNVFEKVITLLVEKSNVEIIFSYYHDEGIGLQIIQNDGSRKHL
jgi:hypothetical protein